MTVILEVVDCNGGGMSKPQNDPNNVLLDPALS